MDCFFSFAQQIDYILSILPIFFTFVSDFLTFLRKYRAIQTLICLAKTNCIDGERLMILVAVYQILYELDYARAFQL